MSGCGSQPSTSSARIGLRSHRVSASSEWHHWLAIDLGVVMKTTASQRVEVREQLVAPGLARDQAAGRVEVEEDRLVAEVGQAVLHLRRERVVGGAVGHEQLCHHSPPPSVLSSRPAAGPSSPLR